MYLKNQLLSLLTIMTGLLLTREWIITTRIVIASGTESAHPRTPAADFYASA